MPRTFFGATIDAVDETHPHMGVGFSPFGFWCGEQVPGLGQLPDLFVHQSGQGFIADGDILAALGVLTAPVHPAMGALAPHQLGPAQAASAS